MNDRHSGRTTAALVSLLAALAVACVTPTTGHYLFEKLAVTPDCPTAEDTGGAEETENEPVKVTLNNEGTEVNLLGVDFPLDGVRFEGELLRYEDDYSYTASLDGVTTCVATLSARWVTSAQINGVTDEDYTCEGPYCADLEAAGARFCGGFVEWEAVLVE